MKVVYNQEKDYIALISADYISIDHGVVYVSNWNAIWVPRSDLAIIGNL